MIEQKIKELLEQYFSNISNWETKKIYFNGSYQLELIKFDFDKCDINIFNSYRIEKEIKEICNESLKYYIELDIKMSNKTVSIKFRYFTRVK